MKKVAALLSALFVAFGMAVATPPTSRADVVVPWTDQEILEAGIEAEELDAFKQYLDDQAYFESDEYVPSFPTDRSVDNSRAPDSRVAILSLWHTNKRFPIPSHQFDCNASQLDEKFFITSKACFRGNRDVIGFVWREGNHYAGIEQVFFIGDDSYDVAIVRVGGGMRNNTYYHISSDGLIMNNKYYATGFGNENGRSRNHSTWARMVAFADMPASEYGGRTGLYGLHGINAKLDRLCVNTEKGVSIRNGDAIYGIFSGIANYPGVTDKDCTAAILATKTNIRKSDIDHAVRTHRTTTLQERVRAYAGVKWKQNPLRLL
ncbi:MAG: hypothetical protein Q3962_00765 [Corynebacterium sp.]|nr:hypothetical protein [Corynebacterium sp.]